MTVETLLRDAWITLGEPTNLDPFVYDGMGVPTGFSSDGSRMLAELNVAQVALATWMFPDGTRLRFPELRDWIYFAAASAVGTVGAGQVSPYEDIAGDFSAYPGWIMVVDGEARLILEGTTTSAMLDRGFSSDPSGKTYTVYKRVYTWEDGIGSPEKPLALYGVFDFEQKKRISRAATSAEDFTGIDTGASTVGTVRVRGQRIIFDVPPESGRFAVEVYRKPAELAALDDESELPESYHPALRLYLEMWGFTEMQENESAYARKRDLIDWLRQRRMTDDLEDDKRELKMVPKVGS